MHTQSVDRWTHEHTFGQDKRVAGERRTHIVIAVTAVTMAIEVAAGLLFGSMALLADGLHMASHASALAISAAAYYYTRRHAQDARFNFGTGKVNSLAGFASAVLLVVIALVMGWESVKRLVSPISIEFNQAIGVAILGLLVNGVSLLILKGRDHHHGARTHGHGHTQNANDHEDEQSCDAHDHEAERHHDAQTHQSHSLRSDLNLWSAYIHVLADALTSLLAIFALLGGKYAGWVRLDPFMGILGAMLVARWSLGLLKASAEVLLDMRVPPEIHAAIRDAVETYGDNRLSDLHVWRVGPGICAVEMTVTSSVPCDPERYRQLIPQNLGVVHLTVETRQCRVDPQAPGASGIVPAQQ